jgi:endonuclease YncB( thermonuclease family)
VTARSWLRAAAAGAALLTVLGSVGCGDTASPKAASGASTPSPTTAEQPPPPKKHRHRRHHRRASVGLERVVDGDTIVISTGAYVRLLQIDTPELSSNECYSSTARTALERLLPVGAVLQLRADPALDRTDRYGRLLRYVFRGGRNVNLAMVRRGAAAPYFYNGDEGRYAARIYALAVAAKNAHRGLWGACRATQLRPDAAVDAIRAGPPSGGGASSGGCEPGYSPCLPVVGDLDCADIPASKKPVHVTGSDPYNLDGNGDGLGCT